MQYFSTNERSPVVDFRTAVLKGQPDDKGLYFPVEIPKLSPEFLRSFREMANDEIALTVMRPYVGDAVSEADLAAICRETVDIPFPLVRVTDRIYSLELFHGPTLAFKDVGARFMSRCLRQFATEQEKKTLVIVATSGDTGGAVAAGFYGVENVEVAILFPKGRISRVQQLQLTTLGNNITAFEIEGAFDDCQRIAKDLLADEKLSEAAFVTSANSINVGRWLPQQFYYFFACKQFSADETPVISVPSGNFGNICAGLVAAASGLKVKRFIAACNANASVTDFLDTGKFIPHPAIPTLSNAMDVGDPSNFPRFKELFQDNIGQMREGVHSASVSDDVTAETIRDVYRKTGYMLDPHGAVAFRVLEDHLASRPDEAGIFLETAHPVKFDSVENILNKKIDLPAGLSGLFEKPGSALTLPPETKSVRAAILARL